MLCRYFSPRRSESAYMVSCQHFPFMFRLLSTSNNISYAKTFTHKTFLFSFSRTCSVKTNLNSGGAVSKLYIANANRNDSGNYTCSLGETAQTTIAVHVLNGMYGLFVIYYTGCNNSPILTLSLLLLHI